MLAPFADNAWSTGSLLVNASTLAQLTRDWVGLGYQVNIHAIGDLAIRLALDAHSAALDSLCPHASRRECQAQHRLRIEHAQVIHPWDQARMLELGIIPSIQPTHATSDMAYAEERLGRQRTHDEAYRMRSLLGLNPVLGSAFPVEPADVFQGIYAAVTRRSPHTGLGRGGEAKGRQADEALNVAEALLRFTAGPAHGAFLDAKAGAIAAGAYADWVVLDDALDDLDIEDYRHLRIRETWVGGKRVYERLDDES